MFATPLWAGCEEDVCDVPLSELSMVATVVDNGTSVRAEVDFASGDRSGISFPYRRCEGDSIRINGLDAAETEKPNRIEYSRTDPIESAPRDYVFTLALENEPVVEARVTLPSAFEVTSPLPGAVLPRSVATPVAWAPASSEIQVLRLELREALGGGICLETPVMDFDLKAPLGIAVPDAGSTELPANAIVSPLSASCDAVLLLHRFSYGAYPDALYPDGYVESSVLRVVAIVSVP